MVHGLEIFIVSEKQTLLDAIENKVPAKLDSRMWADGYTVTQGIMPNLPSEDPVTAGKKFIRVRIAFNETADRQTIMDWMKTKAQGVKANILKGSYIAYHRCDHKTKEDGCDSPTILWSR